MVITFSKTIPPDPVVEAAQFVRMLYQVHHRVLRGL